MRPCVIFILLLTALAASCTTPQSGGCEGFHPATPLTKPAPEGGICKGTTDCGSGICQYPRGAFGYPVRSICGARCGEGAPCALGRVCLGSSLIDAGICVRTCTNAGQCPSSTAEEFCELIGDDAGTRACIAHECWDDSVCGAGFECQSEYCGCPTGAQCAMAAPQGVCRRL